MIKKTALLILTAVVLFALASSVTFAQILPNPTPDAGVKGSGIINTRSGNAGVFDINVARTAATLLGGFKYQEVSTTSNRTNVIYSQRITSLDIIGNTAKITAQGYWNNMPSTLTIEVLDDNPSGDWFHITARPQNMLAIIYDEAGGVMKGDITVFGATSTKDVFTKGEGAIAVGINAGTFRFAAERTNGVVKGNLYYTEYNPMAMSIAIRPKVSIYVPAITELKVEGKIATFSGIGTFNGRRAFIEVVAVDNYNPYIETFAPQLPDTFQITASPVPGAYSFSWPSYYASGPLTRGEIAVETRVIMTTK